jgi:hypothetical protein
MKTQIRKFQFQPILLIVVLALSLCDTAPAQQSAPMPGHSIPSSMPKWCSDMMKMHDEFLKMVKTQDGELTSQVEKMKNAPVDQKVTFIEATLTLMIQQQSEQHAEMAKMLDQMKSNMTKSGCQMMQDM